MTKKEIAAELNGIQLDIDAIQGAIDALLDKIVGKEVKPKKAKAKK